MAGNAGAQDGEGVEQETVTEKSFYIRHYKIKGASKLKAVDVESAVYPFMGPACTSVHVEQARRSLEKTCRDAGYSLVTVSVPPQDAKYGVVELDVSEGKVGRLRVNGAKHFLPEKIKRSAPAVAEGKIPDFERIKAEIIAMNRHPDRQVIPDIRPGVEPGTWDVDLNVKDRNPLHGRLEVNNRYSPDTTELRVNGEFSYTNLWQAGHTIGINFQVAPERYEDAAVYSGYYIFPVTQDVSVMLNGVKQDSDINTLGGATVGGKGHVLGARVNFNLPPGPPFSAEPQYFHSLSLGVEFKHFDENVTFDGTTQATPVEYYPVTLSYDGTWLGKTHSSEVNTSVVWGLRGLGSDAYEFDAKRYMARGNFFILRGDVAHTHDLPGGFEIFAKLQGQLASQPLVNSEQSSGGGLGNARGYLESTVLGDNAIYGSVELRGPNMIEAPKATKPKESATEAKPEADWPKKENEWRFYGFLDAGRLTLHDPLPEQDDTFSLLSIGAGSRLSIGDHLHASVDAGMPLIRAGGFDKGDWLVTFRLWTEF